MESFLVEFNVWYHVTIGQDRPNILLPEGHKKRLRGTRPPKAQVAVLLQPILLVLGEPTLLWGKAPPLTRDAHEQDVHC